MNLSESYKLVKNSIVGFAPNFYRDGGQQASAFGEIVGTGFVVREDGLIVTNEHVAAIIQEIDRTAPAPPPGRSTVVAVIGRFMGTAWAFANMQIMNVILLDAFVAPKVYYGPDRPDIAFVQVNVGGLPVVSLDTETFLEEGLEIGTSGFPLGSALLTAPGYLHQVTPTLRKGVISAVLPFPSPNPHALMIDVTTQGGSSGSPVFLAETGSVIGILYGGIEDSIESCADPDHQHGDMSHSHVSHVPINVSYAEPARYITGMMNTDPVRGLRLPDNAETLDEILQRQVR